MSQTPRPTLPTSETQTQQDQASHEGISVGATGHNEADRAFSSDADCGSPLTGHEDDFFAEGEETQPDGQPHEGAQPFFEEAHAAEFALGALVDDSRLAVAEVSAPSVPSGSSESAFASDFYANPKSEKLDELLKPLSEFAKDFYKNRITIKSKSEESLPDPDIEKEEDASEEVKPRNKKPRCE